MTARAYRGAVGRARGGRPRQDLGPAGDSIVAPIATMALARVGQVGDPVAPPVERDLSVDEAFSQQAFEAVRHGPPDRSAEQAATRGPSAAAEP